MLKAGDNGNVASSGKSALGINGYVSLANVDSRYLSVFNGADSLVGRLCCILQGTTDTTFYVLAVYFGSIGIKNTRHAVACCLISDFIGVIAAFIVASIFFG